MSAWTIVFVVLSGASTIAGFASTWWFHRRIRQLEFTTGLQTLTLQMMVGILERKNQVHLPVPTSFSGSISA